jgi:hypothetical protein
MAARQIPTVLAILNRGGTSIENCAIQMRNSSTAFNIFASRWRNGGAALNKGAGQARKGSATINMGADLRNQSWHNNC